MSIFVSYARKDRTAVETVRHDLERARHTVWLDDELNGGQAWWDTILGQIRTCDLFVFALSPDSLRSKACQSELRYAVALRRPVLPVMVREVSVQLAPPVIADAQIIDCTERTVESAVALVTAAGMRPKAPPIPDPPPAPPPTPMSYMNPYREQIQANDLPFSQQYQLVLALRGHLQDEDERDTARQLLRDLRQRQDIAESVGKEIDALLAGATATATNATSAGATPGAATSPSGATTTTSAASAPSSTTSGTTTAGVGASGATAASASPVAAWYADPSGRNELRYWDGSHWTDHVARGTWRGTDPLQARPAQQPWATATNAASHQHAAAGGEAKFSPGAFVALIVVSIFVFPVGIIVGALNLKTPARRGQAQALLWIGIGMAVVNVLILSSGSQ